MGEHLLPFFLMTLIAIFLNDIDFYAIKINLFSYSQDALQKVQSIFRLQIFIMKCQNFSHVFAMSKICMLSRKIICNIAIEDDFIPIKIRFIIKKHPFSLKYNQKFALVLKFLRGWRGQNFSHCSHVQNSPKLEKFPQLYKL